MDNAAQDVRATRPLVSVEMIENLRSSIRGIIYTRDDVEFKPFTRMFNGNVVTVASIVVLPIDAADVSRYLGAYVANTLPYRVVEFCNTHQLSPSVKAGGYGTAGWAINGDVVINLCKLGGCDIEAPGSDGSFVGLRDMPSPKSKGKEKVIGRLITQSAGNTDGISDYRPSLGNSAKRHRSPEEDGPVPSEADLPLNPLVARFLSGSDRHVADTPAPSVRRRVDSLKDDPISRIPFRILSKDESTDHPSSIDIFSDSTADLGTPRLGGRAIPSDKNAVPGNEANTGGKCSTDGIEASHSTTAQIIGSRGNDKAKEEVNAIIASSQSTLQHSQLSSSGSNSQHNSAAMSESHGRSQSSSQQTGRPPRSGSNLRTDDPFGYLSTAPSSFRSERDYVQQPIFRPPPQHALQTGFYSMASSSSPVGGSLSLGTPIDSTNETQASQHQTFPYFMPSDAVPQYPCAYVTFGAGAKQKDIDLYSHANALPAVDPNGNPCSIAYHVPFAAHPVGSSVMMLGGFGFLSRLHGLSIDALVEAEMVLADGSIVIVNETEHPDLWWALRGAGPAFGIATRYKAKAYPVPIVFAGNLIYNFNPATAASLIKHFRDCIKNAPRELYANVLFTAGPAEKGSVIVVQMCYIGAREKGQEFLQALSSWDGEPCLLNEVSEKTFIHQQDSVAQILRGKAGRQWFIRSALITSLPDEVIHKTVTEFADTPVGCTWLVELAGGAVSDCGTTCFPKSQREAAFTIVALHQWELDDDDPLCISTAEDWIHKTLTPIATAGPYPAFFGRHEYPNRIVGSYGENWSRLCDIKRKYDPNGVFRNCFWPLDKDGAVVDMHVREPPSPKIGLLDDGLVSV